MTQEQIDHNYAAAHKYSAENDCTVWIMCSEYFNSEYEEDRVLVSTYNPFTVKLMELNGFWVSEIISPNPA